MSSLDKFLDLIIVQAGILKRFLVNLQNTLEVLSVPHQGQARERKGKRTLSSTERWKPCNNAYLLISLSPMQNSVRSKTYGYISLSNRDKSVDPSLLRERLRILVLLTVDGVQG